MSEKLLLRAIELGGFRSAEETEEATRWAAVEIASLREEVERLRYERQAVLDCINLYGDETLHSALDSIGWPPE